MYPFAFPFVESTGRPFTCAAMVGPDYARNDALIKDRKSLLESPLQAQDSNQ